MNKLPIYKLGISDNENDEAEVNFVALVEMPAIERNFLAFNKARQAFAIEDEEQRIVTGPAMIADLPIYRNDSKGEYFAVFDASTIAKIAHRFFKKGYQANINTDHDAASIVNNSVFFESWIVDRAKGKMPLKGYEDVADGSWFLTAKINNEDTWNRVKSGEVKGFSVEGVFEYSEEVEDTDPYQSAIEEIEQLLSSLL